MATKKLTAEQKAANKAAKAKSSAEQKAANKAAKAKSSAATPQANPDGNDPKTEKPASETGAGETSHLPEVTGQEPQTGTQIQQDPGQTGGVSDPAAANETQDAEKQRLMETGVYARLHGSMPPASYTTEQLVNLNTERYNANEVYEKLFGKAPEISFNTDQIQYWNGERAEAINQYGTAFGKAPELSLSTDEIIGAASNRTYLASKYKELIGDVDNNLSNEDLQKAIEAKELENQGNAEQREKDRLAEAKKQSELNIISEGRAATEDQKQIALKQQQDEEGFIMAERERNGGVEKKRFNRITWGLLTGDKDGWKEPVKTPPEVQNLKSQS